MGARVEHKSGEEIINTISENVARMLSRKMDAAKCLYKEAERLSEQWHDNFTLDFTYYSAKYSNATVDEEIKVPTIPDNMLKQSSTYTCVCFFNTFSTRNTTRSFLLTGSYVNDPATLLYISCIHYIVPPDK